MLLSIQLKCFREKMNSFGLVDTLESRPGVEYKCYPPCSDQGHKARGEIKAQDSVPGC